jgi:uncharacterized protein YggE
MTEQERLGMGRPTVSVAGHATVTATPDEAVVTIRVSILDKSPERALTEAGERSAELEKIFGELGIGDVGTTGLSVSAEVEYDGKARRNIHRGYRATNQVTVTLSDAALVGRLLQETTERVEADTTGPFWRLALDNPARAEAQRLAAADAKRKAEAYLSALGARLGPIVRVTEPGLSPPPQGDNFPPAPAAPRAESLRPAIEVHTGSLEVAASVEVTFAIDES